MLALHEVLVVVDKQRKIFFIENVKFHIDQVKDLGAFIEIEAIGENGQAYEELSDQCKNYMERFGIKNQDCLDVSYSDMLLKKA